jgi:hypothetical protein
MNLFVNLEQNVNFFIIKVVFIINALNHFIMLKHYQLFYQVEIMGLFFVLNQQLYDFLIVKYIYPFKTLIFIFFIKDFEVKLLSFIYLSLVYFLFSLLTFQISRLIKFRRDC